MMQSTPSKTHINHRDEFILQVLTDKPKFKAADSSIDEFKAKHFFGQRIKRTNIEAILMKK